jgi:hypothetical protein
MDSENDRGGGDVDAVLLKVPARLVLHAPLLWVGAAGWYDCAGSTAETHHTHPAMMVKTRAKKENMRITSRIPPVEGFPGRW